MAEKIILDGPAAIAALKGRDPILTEWVTIDQKMIDAFAVLTHDEQWIHIDTARAATESPYGVTVAHGFLTLSLLPWLLRLVFDYQNRKFGVNYGFDRVRFLAPVPAGSRVRGSIRLDEMIDKGAGRVQNNWAIEVEIEGQAKPAISALWLNQVTYEQA